MSTYYNPRSNQYARISFSSYEDYLNCKKLYDNSQSVFEKYRILQIMDDAAVNAVVFQALAIEAYTNLTGMHIIGEKKFYKRHERKSNNEKLELIEQKIGKCFSTELKGKIQALFDKRNKLVHQKPKPFKVEMKDFDYSNPTSNYDDVSKIFVDFSYAWSNIDEEMTLYLALQNELTAMRGTGMELIDELNKELYEEVSKL